MALTTDNILGLPDQVFGSVLANMSPEDALAFGQTSQRAHDLVIDHFNHLSGQLFDDNGAIRDLNLREFTYLLPDNFNRMNHLQKVILLGKILNGKVDEMPDVSLDHVQSQNDSFIKTAKIIQYSQLRTFCEQFPLLGIQLDFQEGLSLDDRINLMKERILQKFTGDFDADYNMIKFSTMMYKASENRFSSVWKFLPLETMNYFFLISTVIEVLQKKQIDVLLLLPLKKLSKNRNLSPLQIFNIVNLFIQKDHVKDLLGALELDQLSGFMIEKIATSLAKKEYAEDLKALLDLDIIPLKDLLSIYWNSKSREITNIVRPIFAKNLVKNIVLMNSFIAVVEIVILKPYAILAIASLVGITLLVHILVLKIIRSINNSPN